MDSLVDPVEYVPFVILPIDSFQFWVWLVSIIAQGSSVASFLLAVGIICEQPLKLYIYVHIAYIIGPFRRYSSSLLVLPIMEEKSCDGKVVAVQRNEEEGRGNYFEFAGNLFSSRLHSSQH